MIFRESVYKIAEKVLRSCGFSEGIRMVTRSLEANRDDHLSFIKAGRHFDARRAEEAMFRDREVLGILRDWKEG